MKRMIKKTFPFVLLGASLLVVYLNDSTAFNTEEYLQNSGTSIFDLQENDVIVLLHIPGTGMTSLSQSLVTNLITENPCICLPMKTRCCCKNRNGHHWLFQSYNSTGYVCGEHADWSTLTDCPIDQWMENVGHDTRRRRRYWMLTLLREPASRFVHEWHHLVTRDAYFRNEPRLFRPESPELQKKELPCLVGKKMASLTLNDFLECKENPALNRMTRMLANLTEVNSLGYKGDKYNNALLKSAIENLEQLPFFGIAENSLATQELLETTLGLRFSHRLDILPRNQYRPLSEFKVQPSMLRSIRLANSLDVQLYDHAHLLFDRQVADVRGGVKSVSGVKVMKNIDEVNDVKDDDDDDGNDDFDEDGEEEEEDDEEAKSDFEHEKKMEVDESVLDLDANRDIYKSEQKSEGDKLNENIPPKTENNDAKFKEDEEAEEYKDNDDDYEEEDEDKFRDDDDEYDEKITRRVTRSVHPREIQNPKKLIFQGKMKAVDIQASEVKGQRAGKDDIDNEDGEEIDDYNIDNKIENSNHRKSKDNVLKFENRNHALSELDKVPGVILKERLEPSGIVNIRDTPQSVDTEDVDVFFSMLRESKQQKQHPQAQPQQQQLQNGLQMPKQLFPKIGGLQRSSKSTSRKVDMNAQPINNNFNSNMKPSTHQLKFVDENHSMGQQHRQPQQQHFKLQSELLHANPFNNPNPLPNVGTSKGETVKNPLDELKPQLLPIGWNAVKGDHSNQKVNLELDLEKLRQGHTWQKKL